MQCISGICSGASRKRRAHPHGATRHGEERVWRTAAVGRYRRLPRQLGDDYTICRKVLGVGRTGTVLQARCRQTGALVAVKSLNLRGLSPQRIRELETEAEVFLSMDHPHVARLLAVYEGEDCLHFVMERLGGGELLHRLQCMQNFSEQDAAHAVRQILTIVKYLHSHRVVHRDLKLENLLYQSEDSDHLKLIDFGSSTIQEPDSQMSDLVGTLAYMAPEVLAKSYTSQCDLWSVGVITFALLTGQMPFAGPDANVIECIKAGCYPDDRCLWRGLSASSRHFVKGLLAVDPSARPTAEQALGHPWLVACEGVPPCGCLDTDVEAALRSFAQEPRLRQALLEVMSQCHTSEERARVYQAFLEIASNRRGCAAFDDLPISDEGLYSDADELPEACIVKEFGQSEKACCGGNAGIEEMSYPTLLTAPPQSRRGALLGATLRALRAGRGAAAAEGLAALGSCGGGPAEDGSISSEQFAKYLKDVFFCAPLLQQSMMCMAQGQAA